MNVHKKNRGWGGGGGLVQKEQPRLSLTTLIRLAKNKRVGWVGGGGLKAGSERSFYGVPG